MPSPIQEDSFYRRGLVLGLTMAEIVILIIFILLLALSVLTSKKEREIERLTQVIGEKDQQAEILQEKLRHLSGGVTSEVSYDEVFTKLILSRKENEALKNRVAILEEDKRQLAVKAKTLERNIETFSDLRRLIEETANARIHEEDVDQILRQIHDAQDLKEIIQEFGVQADDVEELRFRLGQAEIAAEALQEVREENVVLRDQAEYFKRLSGGRSNEMPPCWIHPVTKKSEYIFDVVLTSAGIVIHDRKIPHRRAVQAELPLDSVQFDTELAAGQFLEQTRSLFRWSETNKCRFYVQVFDKTAPTEKALYKQRLMTVEDHFYKYLPAN